MLSRYQKESKNKGVLSLFSLIIIFTPAQKDKLEAGEMGQQLGALSAFTKDPDSVPSSQTPAHTIWNARSEVLSHMVNSYTYRQNIHIQEKK